MSESVPNNPEQNDDRPPAQPLLPDAHLNFWIPGELMRSIKFEAARTGKSIKEIGIEAIQAYLKGK